MTASHPASHRASARDVVLGRVRAALGDVPPADDTAAAPVARGYRDAHLPDDPAALVDLLAENLADYRARVHRTDEAGLPATLARLLAAHGTRSAVVPPGLPPRWLREVTGVELLAGSGSGSGWESGPGPLGADRLDAVDSVVTGCTVAVAETGTLVLDGADGQGRRILTLVPDHHVCVVRVPEQVVASVPQALRRLDPARPQTWISGPSATSDIELDRVEGVHGPRALDVVLVQGPGT
ncbi:LUD domain-containing protein [Streptomyces sp. V4-01]|uniref:LUD domain-containing protein n=1 Tax=Actinacidiphila polyblastidii TaxID=3110430 RepID=A0ABU7P3J9_9ACTN|nr:LUD domain-containing protein [Streptomyces sp. V4-01]